MKHIRIASALFAVCLAFPAMAQVRPMTSGQPGWWGTADSDDKVIGSAEYRTDTPYDEQKDQRSFVRPFR